jgi:prepilin signal peptidase PulO-like enzyme (type II secretory pathway)
MSAAEAVALALLLTLLAALVWTDLRHTLLPNKLVYPGIAAAFAAAPILPVDGYLDALIGGGVLFVPFFLLYLVQPRAFAGGDVKLIALIGIALGWRTGLLALALASAFAWVIVVPMLLIGRWKLRGTRIPYGPYLCAGTAVTAILAAT